MCAINGFIAKKEGKIDTKKILKQFKVSVERGRDCFGVGWYDNKNIKHDIKITTKYEPLAEDTFDNPRLLLSNHRAEPTTEYIKEKRIEDVHPFIMGNLMLVHNGTIANDKELAKKFDAESMIGEIDTKVLAYIINENCSTEEEAAQFIVNNVKGSYAIALSFGKKIALVNNYKPLYFNMQPEGIYFSSLPTYITFSGEFSEQDNIKKLTPYSYAIIDETCEVKPISFKNPNNNKAIVVCSGGLDSTVALTEAINRFGKDNVTLLHYKYHCNAEPKEVEAVKNISKEMGVELVLMPIDIFGGIITESPILNTEGSVQEYDKGVEFAYEWVPARNLVMMALAIAYSEAKGFGYIYLGNNLEEAGAYPDNEMEFMRKIQEIMPNAVRDGYSLDVVQPVGNLMKHEIVQRGLDIGAPLHLTWSCYKANKKHCGVCGPCRMRRVAFQMAGRDEVIEYEK